MFEYEKFSLNKSNRAVAISLQLTTQSNFETNDSLEEIILLSKTLNIKIIKTFKQKRPKIQPDYYIGKGKLEEVFDFVNEHKIDTIIFDNELTGVQARNLEKYFNKIIFGRTEIILDIFHRRAKTNEAKLQVELACLQYMMPRLRHRWDHFSRVEGGIGMRGGEGEKQIELDRRMVQDQIQKIRKKLKKVDIQMKNRRKQRMDKNTISLVGYTNAGKSTLFNSLSKSDQFTENMLFATLGTTVRKVYINDNLNILLNDTVGFINKLPHTLVASFKSTLEDITNSKLILHIIDSYSPSIKNKIKSVNSILDEIGVTNIPIIRVFNKVDLLDYDITKCIIELEENDIFLSAKNKNGIDNLKNKISDFFLN